MNSKGKELLADAGLGKFVQLNGKETDEEIEQIVNALSAALEFCNGKQSDGHAEYSGASSNTFRDDIQVRPGKAFDVTMEHAGEPSLIAPIGNPNTKLGTLKSAPSPDQEWSRLTDDLALCLASLTEDDYLVITFKRATYYVQFAAQGQFGMRVEAASNAYIEPAKARLSAEAYMMMGELGWQTPTVLPEVATTTDGSPNFFMGLQSPVDFKLLSELAIRTFRQVYRVRHPGQLQYKAFSSSGAQIRFPTLRLKREGD